MSNVIKSNQIKSGRKFDFKDGLQKKEETSPQQSVTEVETTAAEAKEIIAEAESEAQQILQKAKDEAEEIRSQARQEAEEEIESALNDAKERGYQEGFKQGQAEAKDEAITEFKQFLANLEHKTDQFSALVDKELTQTSEEVIQLALAISEKIVKCKFSLDQESIKTLVQEVLKLIDDDKSVKLRVNPDDLEVLADAKEELLATNSIEEVDLITDPNIELGGCIVETDFGGIDATISSQLNQLEEKLRAGMVDE
ncbi:flagellar assembly protein FliH [Halanaerocella petrolearia]